MNDQKIYELMAKTPDIRAVQIADALDQDLTDVSTALKALVDEGDVVRTAGTAPNGQPAQIYNLSATFMKSTEYKAITARLNPPAAPSTQAAAASAPTPAPAPAAVAAAPKSHVDDAIAFIRLAGTVTTAELKQHMGLRSSASPAAWLNGAIRDGRLARNGIHWTIGDGKPPVRAETPKSQAPAAQATAPTIVANAPAPTFRCGLWSDGVLELQRDGATLATLTRNEGEHLTQFFNRMLTTTEAK